jgi:hypothetical protein
MKGVIADHFLPAQFIAAQHAAATTGPLKIRELRLA